MEKKTVKEGVIVRNIMEYLRRVPRCFCWKEHGGIYGTAGIPDIICCAAKKARNRREQVEVLRFFHSQWFGVLTEIDLEYLIRRLDEDG